MPIEDLALMTKHYEVPYSHATTSYHLDSIPSHAEWVWVGAREAGRTTVALGAFGKRNEVSWREARGPSPHRLAPPAPRLANDRSCAFASEHARAHAARRRC